MSAKSTLLGIYDEHYPFLTSYSTPEELLLAMREQLGLNYEHGHPGQLNSRQDITHFMALLMKFLIHHGLEDQLTLELLEQLGHHYSNEYKPWQPGYSFPVTNEQAKLLASFNTYQDMIRVYTLDPDDTFSVVSNISGHHPEPVLVFTSDLPEATEFLSEEEWLLIKQDQ